MVDKLQYSNRKWWVLFIFATTVIIYIIRLFNLQVLEDKWDKASDANARRNIVEIPPRGMIFNQVGEKLVDNEISYNLMVVPRNIDFELLDVEDLCAILEIDTVEFNKRMQQAKQYSGFIPSLFVRRLSPQMLSHLTEKLYRFKGFYVYPRTVRKYYTTSAAHIFGYIAEVNYDDISNNTYYAIGDYIGKSGIEKSYEEQLRGEKGKRVILVDNIGREQGHYMDGQFDMPAISGKSLYISIDKDLQEYGELLMQNKRGSIVAIDPSSGEILCMVTSPAYDPSLLVGSERGSNYMKLQHDSINKPLLNRALIAMYPPGSTFKLVSALVYQQMGVVNEQTLYGCQMGYAYGNRKLGCHGHATPLNIVGSIQNSCNAWYCRGLVAALESRKRFKTTRDAYVSWYEHVRKMGFGDRLESDLPYQIKGFIPTADYYDKFYGEGKWKATSILSISIGQGEICATPVQLANMVAIIANKGYYYPPHLVRAIGDKDSLNQAYMHKIDAGIDEKYFHPVSEGMERAVTFGTARKAAVPGIHVAAKTGTAQNPPKKDHSLLVCYAPVEQPKIALSIIVENGGFGATWAAPIASLMLEKYLKGKVERTDLEKSMMEGKIVY